MSRRMAVLTTGRQDYGILRSTIHALRDDPDFELCLWAGGMHLEEGFGATVGLIEEEGVPVSRRLRFLSDPPDPARDAAAALTSTADALEADRPAALLLLGDRSETMASALAATILAVPVVHLHGGEETEGAIDNALRHAITKLSVLHLTTHEQHAARVLQMGEDPSLVHVVGPPGVDNLLREDLPSRAELRAEVGLDGPDTGPLVAVTVHPTTLSAGSVLAESRAVAEALEGREVEVIITMPNSDEGGVAIREFWMGWADGRPGVAAVESLGERRYWGLLRAADAMIGNSSSGLIEAPAALLPVVNVGDRQKGRLRHPLTLDVPPDAAVVARALDQALSAEHETALRECEPLYPSPPAWKRILAILRGWDPPSLPRKMFRSLP